MRITSAPDIGAGSINVVPSVFGTRTAGTGFARKFGAKRRISQGEFISPVVMKSGVPGETQRSGSVGDGKAIKPDLWAAQAFRPLSGSLVTFWPCRK